MESVPLLNVMVNGALTFAPPLRAERGAVAVRVALPMVLSVTGPVIVTPLAPRETGALLMVSVVFMVPASALGERPIHDRVMHDRVMQTSLVGTVFLV